MLLENLTYPEVEQYLQNKDTILVPVGSVEQHGECGILGTDFIAAEGVAREVGKRMGLLVAPTVTYGVSPHHMEFKGSATLSPTTYIQVITDISLSYVHHGFRRLFFINGHGGNSSGIETAFQQLKMQGIGGQFCLHSWYDGLKETEMVEELFQSQDGSHATPSEISLTMLLRPELFTNREFLAKEVHKADYYWPLTAKEMKKVFPDGRMGAASWLATAEKGRLIMAVAVEALIEKVKKMQDIAVY